MRFTISGNNFSTSSVGASSPWVVICNETCISYNSTSGILSEIVVAQNFEQSIRFQSGVYFCRDISDRYKKNPDIYYKNLIVSFCARLKLAQQWTDRTTKRNGDGRENAQGEEQAIGRVVFKL